MRVGAGDGALSHSIARVRAAREGLGDSIDIMCDAHGTWTAAEAKRFCRAVAECDIAWLEEPVCADDKPGLAEGARRHRYPHRHRRIGVHRFAFRDLALLRAADVFHPTRPSPAASPRRCASRPSPALTRIRLAPHMWGGALTFAAGMHTAAAASSGFTLEYSVGANPLLHELAVEDFKVEDGAIEIPDRPGLGVTIDEAFVARYRVA